MHTSIVQSGYTKGMENTPPKMDKRVFHKKGIDYRQEMEALGVDQGFMRFLVASSLAIPSDHLKPFYSSNLSKAKKLREANFKKIKRQLMKQYGDQWKKRWEEIKKSFKDDEKREYVQTLFGIEPKVLNPFGYPPPKLIGNPFGRYELRNPVTGKLWVKPKPMELRILGFIWKAKTYFEKLTKAKTGKPRPCWKLIAELLEFFPVKNDISGTDVASWWQKSKKDFEPWDGDTFLESHLAFYQRNKLELDTQCKEWLGKCTEWLTKVEESEKGF